MSSDHFVLNPSTTIRFSASDAEEVQIVVGEGSKRVELATSNNKLISWLLKLRYPCTYSQVVENASSILNTSPNEVDEIVHNFMEAGVVVQCSAEGVEVSSSELQWEKWGWRDALDFHRATRDLLWRHDYSSNPEIMTWYLNDQTIPNDLPKPSPKKEKPEWAKVELPSPSEKLGNVSFGTALDNRQTFRNFAPQAISLQDFSDLLSCSFGMTGEKNGKQFYATPTYSLGNHFSIYLVVMNVEGISPGVYYYAKNDHSLCQIKRGFFENEIIEFAQNRNFIKNASFAIFYTIHWEQYMWKYRFSRAYRLALFELAGVVQTCLLAAAALNLKTFLTPAIADIEVGGLLDIEDQLTESPLYITGVGLG
ncbi:SagB/ThcOx family dehydrogenase [Planktothrix agardhii]|uniref:SagB/ThcOx family dehydrogenase n=1 Tax=Planktothrix agardhii TaxID=1160 RepID=UPI0003FF74A4|nr:SagB/ThcOx family dehydrogenase [Planktothrix agardhii]CAD0228223.1 conserved hypothetical protein [Planktothrix agardhii]CAD5944731.1 Trifolitoxin operon protein TfxC [Planktothrix agardhii]